MEHTLNIAYGLSKPTSRKLRERLVEIVELAERLGAEVTVLPPLHQCYENGYDAGYEAGRDTGFESGRDAGYDSGYDDAEQDVEMKRGT